MSAESKLKDAAATTEAAVGEELDEASVWETEFWKVREEQQEEQHAPSAATAETRAAAGKENLDLVYSQPHHRKRQSFVLNDDDDDGLDDFDGADKEDSSKSTGTNHLSKVQAHVYVSSPSSGHIPIKQKHSRTEVGAEPFALYSQSFAQPSAAEDHSFSPTLLGTSAPINIPGNDMYKARRDSRESRGAGSPPRGTTRAEGFVPPHLLGAADAEQELSTSVLRREQLEHRNTILKATGYLEETSRQAL